MIKLFCVGKMKDKSLQKVAEDYCKRISRFQKCEIIELKEANPAFEEARIIEDESRRILEALRDEPVIVFDLKGRSLDSLKFAEVIHDLPANFSLVIGGSLGFSDAVRQRADLLLSLSEMTFPHLLARIMVLEQLFRAFKIIHGQVYHK